MAHPYRSAGRAGAKSKFRSMLGSDKGAKHLNDDSVASSRAKVTHGVDDVKIMGKSPKARLDRARGGKVAKKGVTVNVIVPPSQPPAPPPMLPPPSMAGPPGGPMGRPPMQIPPGPGAGLPMPRASGGRALISQRAVKTQRKFQDRIDALDPNQMIKEIVKTPGAVNDDWIPSRKHGGSIKKAKLTGGADSGFGRLQHSKAQGKHSRGK